MSKNGYSCCQCLLHYLFNYETPLIGSIKSWKIGLLYRAIQLMLLGYVFGWVFYFEKGYQDTDTVVSSVTSKLKGISVTNSSQLGYRVWDVCDYVIPPQAENSFFVMTNVIFTPNQTQGLCPEFPLNETICTSNHDCPPGYKFTYSNGVFTGKCVKYNDTINTCEVFAWCPVESNTEVPDPAVLKDAENFTVLIKNSISYPKFNFSKRNLLPNITASYLRICRYNRVTHPFCPIFRLGSIVEEAGESFQSMAEKGGVIGVQINWNCDLDWNYSHCVPKYSFRRLDNQDDHNVSRGYNFRFAKYYMNNGVESRTLIKVYGIRFNILVYGNAAGLCNIIVLYCLEERKHYRDKLYKDVEPRSQDNCADDSDENTLLRNVANPHNTEFTF
ncbi:P2X purinoceptor 4-like isoform X2 [Mixophyes fleayi]|uniref:P2X purinoceptor 4-like isoform X2 n=1 Tax=Mixophyes fleayi TaxID=3061075 RepID=UPI003F4D8D42